MLKTRIIPVLLYKDVGLVKGPSYPAKRRVGAALPAVRVYNLREVDELVFMDVTATLNNRGPDFQLIDDLADHCFMPMTVGGGVRHKDDIAGLLAVGADKVALNSAAIARPELVKHAAQEFGRQCIVVAIDAKRGDDGRFEVYSKCGTEPTGLVAEEWAKEVADLGAGEILLTSIDQEGSMEGYDLELLKVVSQAVSIPVIIAGGCGSYEHMVDAVTEGGASAIAAASIFHFTEQTPREAKQYLAQQNIAVRL